MEARKGSITVYLSLTLAIMASFILTMCEAVRLHSIKALCVPSSFSSMESSFAGFASQLFDSYGIFGVYTDDESLLSSIKLNAYNNMMPFSGSTFSPIYCQLTSVSYSYVCHLTDRGGSYFAAQAADAAKQSTVVNALEALAGTLSSTPDEYLEAPTLNGNEIAVNSEALSKIKSMAEDVENAEDISDEEAENAASKKESIISFVTTFISSKFLSFVVGDTSSVSKAAISSDEYSVLPSIADRTEASGSNGTTTDILILAYIIDHFSSYADDDVNAGIGIKYQREYILAGNRNDVDNLTSAITSILNMRAGLNLIHIISDSSKCSEVISLARAACINLPVASELVAAAIMGAWSYAEALIDVRDLMAGKKVPLIKSSSEWTLSLDGIVKLAASTVSKNSGSKGLGYDEYLDVCLMNLSESDLYYRTMDLIQTDMRLNYNQNFSAKSCVVAATANFNYSITPLFSNLIYSYSASMYDLSVSMSYGYN